MRRPVELQAVGDRRLVARERALPGLRGVPGADRVVVLRDPLEEGVALPVAEQLADDRHRAGGVLHPHDRTVVLLVDLDRRVRPRRRGTAEQQRDLEALALHLGGDAHHLVEARRDEAGQADDVGVVLRGRVEDLLGRHHDAEVDDVVVVALQHDADDVLADVVDVALDGRRDDEALAPLLGGLVLLRLDVGDEVRDGLLHDAGRLHHLRQEHLAVAEEVADDVHAVLERALDDLERPPARLGDLEPQLLGVVDDVRVDALDEGVRDPLAHGHRAPLLGGRVGHLAAAAVVLGDGEEPVGRVGAPVEHDVLDGVAQLGVDGVVGLQGAGVDDAHVHAGLDGVEEEDRVDRLAHRVVAAEAEGDVRDAAGHQGVGQGLLDPAGRLDVVGAVGRVLLDARRHREDVRVEDDVLGREADLVDEDPVGPLADDLAALEGVGLALLVERHDDDGGAVLARRGGRARGTAPRPPSSRSS